MLGLKQCAGEGGELAIYADPIVSEARRDRCNGGHYRPLAIILDNQNKNILLWSETRYQFVKRQSQADPNVWVSFSVDHHLPLRQRA